MVRSTNCNVSFNANSYHQIDADTKGYSEINKGYLIGSFKNEYLPVEWIVNIWEQVQQMDWIKFSKTVSTASILAKIKCKLKIKTFNTE